jgi:hypothetical protein
MSGSVMKVSLDGGSPVPLASAQDNPSAIAIDSTSVYFTSGVLPGTAAKVPLAGGRSVTFASGLSVPTGIAVDSTSAYVTNSGPLFGGSLATSFTVLKVALIGGPATILASGQYPNAIAVDSSAVYWTNGGLSVSSADGATVVQGGAVMETPIGGGTPFALAQGGSPAGIAQDGSRVYWTDSSLGTIMSVVK